MFCSGRMVNASVTGGQIWLNQTPLSPLQSNKYRWLSSLKPAIQQHFSEKGQTAKREKSASVREVWKIVESRQMMWINIHQWQRPNIFCSSTKTVMEIVLLSVVWGVFTSSGHVSNMQTIIKLFPVPGAPAAPQSCGRMPQHKNIWLWIVTLCEWTLHTQQKKPLTTVNKVFKSAEQIWNQI